MFNPSLHHLDFLESKQMFCPQTLEYLQCSCICIICLLNNFICCFTALTAQLAISFWQNLMYGLHFMIREGCPKIHWTRHKKQQRSNSEGSIEPTRESYRIYRRYARITLSIRFETYLSITTGRVVKNHVFFWFKSIHFFNWFIWQVGSDQSKFG